MQPAERDISIYRGDGYAHVLDFEGEDQSGFEFAAEVREHPSAGVSDGTPLASFTVDDTDAATGTIVLRLTPGQTRGLPTRRAAWDVERWPTGDTATKLTLLRGVVTVTGDVTK